MYFQYSSDEGYIHMGSNGQYFNIDAAGIATNMPISANQITAGTLTSGVTYTGTLNAGQINTGEFTAARIVNGEIGRVAGNNNGDVRVDRAIAGNPILIWGYIPGNNIQSGWINAFGPGTSGQIVSAGCIPVYTTNGLTGDVSVSYTPLTLTAVFTPPYDGDYSFQLNLSYGSGSDVAGTILAVHTRR
jgi:hypothetical protein